MLRTCHRERWLRVEESESRVSRSVSGERSQWMRDLQNALSIFPLRNVGIPYNVDGALPNSEFSLRPSPAFFHCSSLTVDIMLLSKLYIFPGLASVPFHAFIVASFWKLRRKKRPPTRILLYSLASLFYVALDVLPSAFLFTGTTPFSPVIPSLN